MTIQLPAEVENLSTRRDKSMKLTFGTLELSPSEAMELFSLQNQSVYLAIKNIPFSKDELDFLDKLHIDVADMDKSPSKRQRDIIYVLFTQQPEGYVDFNLFYAFKMNQIADFLKAKLKPNT